MSTIPLSRFLALLIGLLTALSALVAASPSQGAAVPAPTAGRTAERMAAAPKVGQCRNYGYYAAFRASNTSPVIGCRRSHTARVLAVPRLPEGMGWDASIDQLDRVMQRACLPKWNQALGRTAKTRQRSAYTITWFIPTRAQRANGARWIRCDIVLQGGTSLKPIPKDSSPMLPRAPLPDSVAKCLSGDRYLTTRCVQPHHHRATGATFVKGTAYPGKTRLRQIAINRCPHLVSTPRRFYATWPSRNAWLAGQHIITCYSRTSR